MGTGMEMEVEMEMGMKERGLRLYPRSWILFFLAQKRKQRWMEMGMSPPSRLHCLAEKGEVRKGGEREEEGERKERDLVGNLMSGNFFFPWFKREIKCC